MRSVHQISIGVQPTPARLRDRAPKGGAASPVNERFYKGGQFWPARPAGPDVVALMNEPAPEPIRLAIYGFTYTVRPIAVAAECGTAGFEMHRIDTGNTYHVHRDNYGCVKCDCGDYLFRHDGTATTCKHGSALVAKGLIPAPSPIPSTVGRRVISGASSVWENATPTRFEPKPAGEWVEVTPYVAEWRSHDRPRRFEPSPEEMAEAAQIFGDLAGACC